MKKKKKSKQFCGKIDEKVSIYREKEKKKKKNNKNPITNVKQLRSKKNGSI
jgi:hypothetical protein